MLETAGRVRQDQTEHFSSTAWIAVGVVAVVVGAAVVLLRPSGREQDLGTVSAGWIAEHNARKSGGPT
jgi:hypothetical protein